MTQAVELAAMAEKRKRLFVGRQCHCGSRLWHQLDYSAGWHFAVCERRQHRTRIDKPWAPTLFDFLCECGGMFLATTNRLALASGEEMMRDFACPACATRWRILAPPERSTNGIAQHLAVSLALLHHTTILEELGRHGNALELAGRLRGYTNAGESTSLFTSFFRNLFCRYPEQRVPPADMPERVEFLAKAKEAANCLRANLDEEEGAGLLVWCNAVAGGREASRAE